MKSRLAARVAGCASALSLLIGATNDANARGFTGLGDLDGGRFESFARAVSADGLTVVGDSVSDDGIEAFRWTADDGMDGLGDLGGGLFLSIGADVSEDGAVVVGTGQSGDGSEAFRWTGAMAGLGDLGGGIFLSSGSGVSADGSIVVGASDSALGVQAYRWTAADGMDGLGDLPGGISESGASDVSADGDVVVGSGNSADGDEAFRWTDGDGMEGLGDLPGGEFFSRANGISADGLVIVGESESDSGLEAFRWTADDGLDDLGDLAGGGFLSVANAASLDGSVVVGRGTSRLLGEEAFVWDADSGMRSVRSVLLDLNVDVDDWQLISALGVSDDGRIIVGYGTNPDGDTEAWRADISGSSLRVPFLPIDVLLPWVFVPFPVVTTFPLPPSTEPPKTPVFYFDPVAAIGYDYQAQGVNFASVLLPAGIGDGLYELYLWDGAQFVFSEVLTGGVEHLFTPGGVDRFRILGIEPGAALDPNDPVAFPTGLSFAQTGTALVIMTPLIPEPSTFTLIAASALLLLVCAEGNTKLDASVPLVNAQAAGGLLSFAIRRRILRGTSSSRGRVSPRGRVFPRLADPLPISRPTIAYSTAPRRV